MVRKTVDYYEVLGIEKTASDDQIRKAYRKLSLKWHPDKNKDNSNLANEKFKCISEAYEILSDPVKRRRYDAGGGINDDEFAEFHSNFSSDQAQRIFEMFFGGNSMSIFSSNNFFSNDDPFSSLMGGGIFHGDDPFRDMMKMRSSFGSGGVSKSFTTKIGGRSMGGGRSVSESTSSSTRYENGERVTRIERTVVNADGSVNRTVTEERDDGKGNRVVHTKSALPGNAAGYLPSTSHSKGSNEGSFFQSFHRF